MSVNNIDEISNIEDFFSAKSDISQSYESLKQMDLNELNSSDILQKISNLQDIRYDATYKISQIKQKICDIEKEEMSIMKESTIQHSNLQENYVTDHEEENHIKKLAEEAAIRLGKMKFELKMVNEQVVIEQQKLEELEEQSERLNKRLEECDDILKSELRSQLSILEDQRDQQAKTFEDLEFKELETQSRFEEESETLKSNIIEAQRKFIMSTRNRENRKLFFDEQQILLMKNTRKNLDKLESERNYCNQQIAHYQNILNLCSSKIEELNKQIDKIKFADYLEQNWRNPNSYEEIESAYMSSLNSINNGDINNQTLLVGPSYNPNDTLNNNNSLQDRLDSLTEIVKLNLNLPSKSESKLLKNDHTENIEPNNLDSYANSYPSTFSLSDDAESLSKNEHGFGLHRLNKPTAVTFECLSIEESTSSNQSPGADTQTKSSRSDLNSVTSNNDENSHPDSQVRTSIIRRNKDKHASKKSKQSRPLTCFLPKLHSDFNLLKHIESCGHDLTVIGDHVQINQNSCQGFLWKLSNRLFGVWRKRWFDFDHSHRTLKYYNSKSKSKIKGSIDFQSISDVFVDHTHRARSPQKLSLCVETQFKSYYLIAAKPELVTLWVDVIFTGAEAYLTLHHPSMNTSIYSQSAE